METVQIIVSVVTVLVASASFIVARRSDVRSKKAELIKNLLGEKETVGFAALKLLQDGLPKNKRDRSLVVSSIVQACVFERSDRARALLYRAIEKNREAYGDEFKEALEKMRNTFERMDTYKFTKKELNLETGRTRIVAVDRVINPKSTE